MLTRTHATSQVVGAHLRRGVGEVVAREIELGDVGEVPPLERERRNLVPRQVDVGQRPDVEGASRTLPLEWVCR